MTPSLPLSWRRSTVVLPTLHRQSLQPVLRAETALLAASQVQLALRYQELPEIPVEAGFPHPWNAYGMAERYPLVAETARSRPLRRAGQPLGAGAAEGRPCRPRSGEYVQQLLTDEPLVSVNGWTVPVYEADAGTRTYAVRATEDYAPDWSLPAVPIPNGAAPDPESDGHMVVGSTQCVYEFWQARRTGDGWTASWVNATPADGTGVYPRGWSARASGMSAGAGLIWPPELASGEINHALVFAYPSTADGRPVAPATSSDGETDAGERTPQEDRLRPAAGADRSGKRRREGADEAGEEPVQRPGASSSEPF